MNLPLEQLPTWAAEVSPSGHPWSQLLEHRLWFEEFPEAPPFQHQTPLREQVLRKSPSVVPEILRPADCSQDLLRALPEWDLSPEPGAAKLFGSALGRVIDRGPEFALAQLSQSDPAELQELVQDLKSQAPGQLTSPEESLRRLRLLLSPAAQPLADQLRPLAHARTRAFFSGKIAFYAPIYLSNACTNDCSYCGFQVKNPMPRVTLNSEELEEEARILSSTGQRRVLLVTGEAPKIVPVSRLADTVASLKRYFPSVSIEVYPLLEEGYREVVAAGAEGLTIYQETYEPSLYRRVHRGGRKRDFFHRLGATERAARAGMRQVGCGALLGLGDFRYEALCLGLHLLELSLRYPQLKLALSFPRLRPAAGEAEAPTHVGDAELLQLLNAFRLALGPIGFTLSTREHPEFRDEITRDYFCAVSAGVSTEPGGYAKAQAQRSSGAVARGLPQFEIADERSLEQLRHRLPELGLEELL